jgi:hypothetical protein
LDKADEEKLDYKTLMREEIITFIAENRLAIIKRVEKRLRETSLDNSASANDITDEILPELS